MKNEEFEELEAVDFKKKEKKKKTEKEKAKKEQQKDEKLKKDNEKRYKDLLKRITETLYKNNPDLAEKTKISIKPPQVVKEGTRKTAILNFQSICKQLDRHPEHVMNFFLEDLGGSSGSLGNKGFVIRNVLTQKNVENLFRKYISEFVQCQLCRRQNTELVKDDKMRLWTIHCNSCKSNRSVRTIKGAEKKFEAVVETTEQEKETE